MASADRIDELRRRVDHDPASIAFAQLAEEYRRAGLPDDAVTTCRRGLATHPDFLSARVTLGRSLLALGRLDDAAAELSTVLTADPDNLPALRSLSEVCRLQGRQAEAAEYHRSAVRLSPLDPDLERIILDINVALGPPGRGGDVDPGPVRAAATVAALEQWLEAIRATRAERRP